MSTGFAGIGAMGSALAGAMVRKGLLRAEELLFLEPSDERAEAFRREIGARRAKDPADLAAHSRVLFLAVKPQHLPGLLADLKPHLGPQTLLVSIAAGVSIQKIQALLAPAANPVARAMPNTPARVGAGVSAIAFSANVAAADRERVGALFAAAGRSLVVDEKLMNAVTAVSGSGPAYVFLFIEALADAGVRQGLPRDIAQTLALETVRGAAELVRDSGLHPAVLKDQVTSPGGTTIAALEALEAGGLRSALFRAVAAATKRAEELG